MKTSDHNISNYSMQCFIGFVKLIRFPAMKLIYRVNNNEQNLLNRLLKIKIKSKFNLLI